MLWDIDRTLVDAGDVSRKIYATAFHRVNAPRALNTRSHRSQNFRGAFCRPTSTFATVLRA